MKTVEYSDIDFLLCMMNREEEKKKAEQIYRGNVYEIEDNICILVPENFVEASDEYIKTKYFSQNLPEKILKNEYGDSNLMFQVIEKEPADIDMALMLATGAIRSNDRTVTIYEREKAIKSNYVYVWMDYKNFAGSECIYNILFIIDTGEKRVFGAFNCLFEKYDLWKPIVLRMLDSLTMKEKSNERILD